MKKPSALKLSICIGTFNRADFIGEALESIISQATGDCEIVVSDNASTDNTEQVVSTYARRFDRLRYIKHDTNRGFDLNFDCAVERARGEYCWLFSDDDVMKPGAIATVLEELRRNYCLVLVNGEHKDFTSSNVRVPSFFGIESDRVYGADEFDCLFTDVGKCLMCICCVVIKREVWVGRERQRYYGSWFIHAAVILQNPLPGDALVIAKPLMSLRLGNVQTHAKELLQVWLVNWPSLVWSSCLSESTKREFCIAEPWRRPRYLLAFRAMGGYSLAEYRGCIRPRLSSFRKRLIPRIVALLPRELAQRVYELYSSASGRSHYPFAIVGEMFPESWSGMFERSPPGHDR